MPRIGILTFHRSINYGAYMQCFSLSKKLQKAFPDYEIEVIDYESKIMHDTYIPKFTLGCIKRPNLYSKRMKKYRGFLNALKYLSRSDKYFIFDGEDESFNSYLSDRYDAIAVGSDAVWNWIKRGFPNPYLLLNGNYKKFSYAASAYGMGMEYVGTKEQEIFSKSLVQFSFIGVRDSYTETLVKNVLPTAQPVFTCDPTFFLDLEEVLSTIGQTRESFYAKMRKKYKIPSDKIIIGVMETDKAIIKNIKKEYGKKSFVISLYNNLSGADCNAIDLSPLEWALMFGLFDITVTNYFHGTLLSLRNNTPVISIDRTDFSEIYEGKIHDVMRRMDLLDCFFDKKATSNDILKQMEVVCRERRSYCDKISTKLEEIKQSFADFEQNIRKNL